MKRECFGERRIVQGYGFPYLVGDFFRDVAAGVVAGESEARAKNRRASHIQLAAALQVRLELCEAQVGQQRGDLGAFIERRSADQTVRDTQARSSAVSKLGVCA